MSTLVHDFINGALMKKPNTRSAKILDQAIAKTDQVQEELHDAAQALSGANAVLSQPVSTAQSVSAIAGAVKQNLEAESKVQDATQELETVKELLHEVQVAQAAGDAVRNSGEGTASILGYFEGRRAQAREDEAKTDPKT
jgi:ABC-type transporter Mla subunit MlaD